jgi:hypothetical protein
MGSLAPMDEFERNLNQVLPPPISLTHLPGTNIPLRLAPHPFANSLLNPQPESEAASRSRREAVLRINSADDNNESSV